MARLPVFALGAIEAAGVPLESPTRSGDQDWDFWRASFPRTVLFHAAFGRAETAAAGGP